MPLPATDPVPPTIYDQDISFSALAATDPDFARCLKGNGQLDFSVPGNVAQLTKSLLKRDFQLEVEVPLDRLIPPVPNRFNYIVWLQTLLDTTSPDFRDSYDPNREVLGVDIGTGASCIYPLLATRQRPNWRMIGTDIDTKSLACARQNVQRNGLEGRIKVVEAQEDREDLVPGEVWRRCERIDFVMTNPPFYTSDSPSASPQPSPYSSSPLSRPRPRPAKTPQTPPKSTPAPASAFTTAQSAAIHETHTPSGEVGFITRLITQSQHPQLRTRVQWWSSMVGRRRSLGEVVAILKERGCQNWCAGVFGLGRRTRRWVVAWSWMGWRPLVERSGLGGGGDEKVEGGLLPFPPEFGFVLPPGGEGKLGLEMEGLEGVRWLWKPEKRVGLLVARKGDCWSRRARRRMKQRRREKEMAGGMEVDHDDTKVQAESEEEDDEDEDEDEDGEENLVLKIQVLQNEIDNDTNESKTRINVRWMQGHDHVLFESFCGWLKGRIQGKSQAGQTIAD